MDGAAKIVFHTCERYGLLRLRLLTGGKFLRMLSKTGPAQNNFLQCWPGFEDFNENMYRRIFSLNGREIGNGTLLEHGWKSSDMYKISLGVTLGWRRSFSGISLPLES